MLYIRDGQSSRSPVDFNIFNNSTTPVEIPLMEDQHVIITCLFYRSRCDHPPHHGNADLRYQRLPPPRLLHQGHRRLDRRLSHLRVRRAVRICPRELRLSVGHAPREHEEEAAGDGERPEHGRRLGPHGHRQQHDICNGEPRHGTVFIRVFKHGDISTRGLALYTFQYF